MVIAAGKTIEKKEVITHNRLCEEAGRLLKDEAVWESIDIIRSVALPVYRRLVKEQRTHVASLLQALLHILAWRSGWLGAGPGAKNTMGRGRVRNGRHRFANRFRSGIGRERDDVSVIA